MIITKIILDNFKIYKHQEFDIAESKFILLTGSNGFGKTTLIDAIEWCLTGDISRIKNCFEERNSKQTEKIRAENNKGIIKNSESKSGDIVKVTLYLNVKGTKVIVYREQKEDNLYSETEMKFGEDLSKDLKEEIEKYTSKDKFYNYHVCDIHKSFNFLNHDRKQIKSQFDDFIKPHPIADSLSLKLQELINELNANENTYLTGKVSTENITADEKELEAMKANIKVLEYPQIKLYQEEIISIENEPTEKLREQLAYIKKCGYSMVSNKIDNSILFYKAKEQHERLDALLEFINNNEEDIYIAIKNSYYNTETLEGLNKKIKEITNLRRKVEEAYNFTEIIDLFASEEYSEISDQIKLTSDKLIELENELKEKRTEIREKEKGNEIITILSNLVAGKEGIIEYKNEGFSLCPLCGSSERFQTISSADELAVEAEQYLDKSKTDLGAMKKKVEEKTKALVTEFNQFKNYLVKYLFEKIAKYDESKKTFNDYFEKTKHFFVKLIDANISIDENCIVNIRKKKTELNGLIMKEELKVKIDIDQINNVLVVLNKSYDLENVTSDLLKKLKLDIQELSDEEINRIENFDFSVFNKKIMFIENLLNNQEIHRKETQIVSNKMKNKEIDEEITKIKLYKEKAEKLRNEIEKNKAHIEKLELEEVGQYLYKIFTKVIKHTKITEFKFKRDGSRIASGGATFSDQYNNNIHNILSQGQLGVFILSYFFANMFKRKDETIFKTYFVDDITSCLDDMNILSFVDIIKYQLFSEDGVINQFFFSTCDGDLEKLFMHKMKSFNIDWKNIKFITYAKGIMLDSEGNETNFGLKN